MEAELGFHTVDSFEFSCVITDVANTTTSLKISKLIVSGERDWH